MTREKLSKRAIELPSGYAQFLISTCLIPLFRSSYETVMVGRCDPPAVIQRLRLILMRILGDVGRRSSRFLPPSVR
jgi:hypothetical protein